MRTPCVFFDRDGIANEPPTGGAGYILRVEDFRVEPGFLDALAVAADKGYAAVVVTNQRCVALGLLAEDTLESLHAALREAVERRGLELTDLLACPHDNGVCSCRKPLPGMLLEAARRHNLDLARSWMVGDNETDVLAGRAAGCRTVRVHPDPGPTAADHTLSSMDGLAAFLAEHL